MRKTKRIVKFIIALIVVMSVIFVVNTTTKNDVQEKFFAMVNGIKEAYLVNDTGDDEIDGTSFLKEDLENDDLNILFLYVGQADCTLIKIGEKVMMIDTGNNEDGKKIISFLQQMGIEKIDYLIGTHADEDHIGSVDKIVKAMEVSNLYMPKIGEDVPNYKYAKKAADSKNIEIVHPKVGDTIAMGEATCEILSAMEGDEISNNDSSLVIEMTYKGKKFLFMGDATKTVEDSKNWEKVDLLKVGHHGSNSSSSKRFLNQIKPTDAIISVGKENEYNLPSKYAIQRLQKVGAKIYRTDTNGSSFWVHCGEDGYEVREVNVDLDGANECATKT